MSTFEKPRLDQLIHRDAFYFALQKNRHLLRFYRGGMNEEEFSQENKMQLNEIIARMDKFYGFRFRNKPWLNVAIRGFLSDLGIPLYAAGRGVNPGSRDKTIVDWQLQQSRYIT